MVLVDPTAPRHTEEVFIVFKAASLNFVGIIPENKGVEARVPVLQEIEPLFYILLEKLILSTSINPLATLDFVKAPPSPHNTQIDRPKRSNAGKKHGYHLKRARLLCLPSNLPQQKSYQKHQKVQIIAVVSKNSLLQVYHIKRIEKKLDFLMGTQHASKMRDEKKLAKKLNQIEQLKLKMQHCQKKTATCPLTCFIQSSKQHSVAGERKPTESQ